MATWNDLSKESLEAAKKLTVAGCFRSSISRSYYAAYAAVTSELVDQDIVRFAHGRSNPGHDQLLALISYNLKRSRDVRRRLRRIVRLLREAREDADYRPSLSVDRKLTLACIRDASVVLQEMGVTDETRK